MLHCGVPYRRTPAVQARLDGRRDAVLDAAVALLAEQGYQGCSMAAVAARAGIATGSLYQHFPSKSVLAVELFRLVAGREVAAVEDAAQRAVGVRERVVSLIETFCSRALKSPRLAYALLAEPVDAAVDAERLVFRRAFRDVFAAAITDGVRTGVLPPQDGLVSAAAVVGAGAEVLVGPLSGETASGPEPVAELVRIICRALGVPDVDDA